MERKLKENKIKSLKPVKKEEPGLKDIGKQVNFELLRKLADEDLVDDRESQKDFKSQLQANIELKLQSQLLRRDAEF